ncbi:Protein-lysine N-methyltransferase efm4 [Marasmius sp. AFHP31]|nr:Protein-lysine N-methyltransferase efm4 [Marasmius sp. AFHP31]
MTPTDTGIRVSNPNPLKTESCPSHCPNDEGTALKNTWKSWREYDWRDQFYVVFKHSKRCPTAPENISELIPARKPTWTFKSTENLKLKAITRAAKSAYLAGDTGHRAVLDGQDEDEIVPACKAFEQIGKKFGSIDLAMLPIGYVQA